MSEHDIQNQIRLEISKYGKFFRANVGEAWTGPEVVRTEGGGVYIPKAHRFNTGLPNGFSDVFGVVPVFITPEMLSQTIGVAAFLEIKSIRGRVSPEQENFLSVMKAAGCLVGVARNVDQAVKIIGGM